MRQLLVAAAVAFALAACGQGGANGPALPQVKAGATPPSTQSEPGPSQPAQIDDATRQALIQNIGQQLGGLQSANAAGWSQVGSDTIIPMQPGRDHRFLVDLTGGAEYRFIGACDGDCSNVDLELISMETGGVVANDMLPDDYPVFRYTPAANGQYMVRLLMQSCTATPCYAGARVVSDQPAAGGGGGAQTATGGGTPGKP